MGDQGVQHGPVLDQGLPEDPLFYFERVFCRFFQSVFSKNAPGCYKWFEDEEQTEIIIRSVHHVNAESVERRPAVLVKRGGLSFGNLSFNQFLKQGNQDGETVDKKVYSDLNSSSIVLRCLASAETEAGRIAWHCAQAIRRLKAPLQRAAKIHRIGEDIQIAEPSEPGMLIQPESSNEITMISVFIPFFYQDSWSTEPIDKLLLKELQIDLTSELNYPAPGAEVIFKGPQWYGRPLAFTERRSLTQRVKVK